jgi:transposase
LEFQKKTIRASEQDREDVKQAREKWIESQPSLDIEKLVFLDESGAKTNMTRLRGRAKDGQRCYDHAPCGRWSTTTMISSVRLDGSTAAMVIEGATTGDVFEAYVREVLCPTLRPGDIVVMDNLSSHKRATLEMLIEQAGASVRFLPPYSPDLNPIEMMWSKVKSFLRTAKARTQTTLLDAIAAALKTVTANDAKGWFTECGYPSSHS